MRVSITSLARLLLTLLLLGILMASAFLPMLLRPRAALSQEEPVDIVQHPAVLSPALPVSQHPTLSAKQNRANDQLIALWTDNKGVYDGKKAKALTLQAVQRALAQGADVDAKDWEGETTLIPATNDGNIALVRFLLSKGADPNGGQSIPDKGFDTPLTLAVMHSNLPLATLLLDNHAAVDMSHDLGDTPLIWAARYDNLPMVRLLLEHGANVNAVSSNEAYIGATALIIATAFKDLPMAQALLASHADPNVNVDGYNALSLAAENDQTALAELLLSHGATVEIQNEQGETPLISSAHFPAMIRVLLAHGAQVDGTRQVSGETALMATLNPLLGTSTPASKSVECLRLLLAAGANVNATAADGRTALICAAEVEDMPAATFLLDHGALMTASIQGDSLPDGQVLVQAAAGTYGESPRIAAMLRLLLDRGADPNEAGRSGWTALMYRAKRGDLDSVQLLLDRGADVNAKSTGDGNVLNEAAESGNVAVVQLLRKHGAVLRPDINGETVLMQAASSGSIPLMQMFLASGLKINDQAKDGETPLERAVSSQRMEAVKFLLAHGAKIDVRCQGQTPLIEALSASMEPDALVAVLLQGHPDVNLKDASGMTALMGAVRSDRVKIIQGLLASGANVNLKANDGTTALMDAVDMRADDSEIENNQVQTVKLLLSHGAQVNARDNTGRTALMISAGWGDATIVRLLLAHGAKIKLSDSQGETALSLAATNVRPEMVKLLKAAGAKPFPPAGNPKQGGSRKP